MNRFKDLKKGRSELSKEYNKVYLHKLIFRSERIIK